MSSNAAYPLLQTNNLTRQIEDKKLVSGISIEIHSGEVVAIAGPSGAGKSSLLRLLNRLDEPTDGTVIYKGKDYKKIPPWELRRSIGMVMQQPYLFPGSVQENLGFGPQQRGQALSLSEAEKLLSQVNLADYAQRDVSTLSGGEAQRVSLARTLANLPEVLLLDEPTSSLDGETRQGIEELIQDILTRHNLTAVLVTHDMDQAHRLADRILFMRQGQIVKSQEKAN